MNSKSSVIERKHRFALTFLNQIFRKVFLDDLRFGLFVFQIKGFRLSGLTKYWKIRTDIKITLIYLRSMNSSN